MVVTYTEYLLVFVFLQYIFLGSVHVRGIEITVACDENMTLYINGRNMEELIPGHDKWQEVDKFQFNENLKNITISCVNTGGPGGIFFNSSCGVKTDTTWECHSGWCGHGNVSWTAAIVNFSADYPRWPEVKQQDIIWNSIKEIDTVCCRKILNETEDTPCTFQEETTTADLDASTSLPSMPSTTTDFPDMTTYVEENNETDIFNSTSLPGLTTEEIAAAAAASSGGGTTIIIIIVVYWRRKKKKKNESYTLGNVQEMDSYRRATIYEEPMDPDDSLDARIKDSEYTYINEADMEQLQNGHEGADKRTVGGRGL